MDTSNSVAGLRRAILFAEGKSDTREYLRADMLPFGPDRPEAARRLGSALLAAHLAAPTYWEDDKRRNPIWEAIREAKEIFARDYKGEVDVASESYTYC